MLLSKLKAWLSNWQEWGITILLFLSLEVAIASIEQARWISPNPSLTLVLVLAVVSGWLLCKSRLPAIVLHPVAVVLGAAVTVWQASSLMPSPELTLRFNQLAVALKTWWQVVNAGEPSEGTIQFAVLLIFFAWIMGYISTYFVLRKKNAWVTISLSAITILINLGNLPEQQYVFFRYYLLMALLLVAVTSLAKNYYLVKKQGTGYPSRGVIYVMTLLVFLSALVVSIAWLTPKVRVEPLETFLSTKMVLNKNIEKHLANFLASVPAKLPFLGGDVNKPLLFGDSSFDRGNQLEFLVTSELPLYWQTRMYNSYNSLGWTSSNVTERVLGQGSRVTKASEILKREEMTYTVIPKVKTTMLLSGGEFVSSSIPVSVLSIADLNAGVDDGQTPGSTATGAELSQTNVTGMPAAGDNTVAVSSLYPIWPDRRYTVTASIISSAPEVLSEAGGAYPLWVTDYYLSLPLALPERIRQLSEEITKDVTTPYDKVLAVQDYLARIDYVIEAKAPPPGLDGVDYFLFTEKSGNCVQFASAMAVMLRSVGIPSRISVGYAPGEVDAAVGRTILTAKERHAWPEVYFTSYGWVGFEATPGAGNEQEAITGADRGSGNLASQNGDEFLEEDIGGGSIGGPGNTSNKGLNVDQLLLDGFSVLVMLVLAIGIVIALAIGGWLILPGRRGHFVRQNYSFEIYRNMCFLASLARLRPQPQQTPLEYSASLASVFPLQAQALSLIAEKYVERQYSSRKELGVLERWNLLKAWREVRPRLIRQLFRIMR